MQDDVFEGLFTLEGTTVNEVPSDEVDIIDEPIVEQAEPVVEERSTEDTAQDNGDETISKYIEFLQANELVEVPEDIQDLKGTPEELQAIFEHTKKARVAKTVESIFEALPQDFKPLFEYALAGGDSLDEFLSVYGKDPIESVNLNNEDSQRHVLREYYKRTTQYTPEKIERMISYLSDPEDLRTAAEEAFEDLTVLKAEEKEKLIQNKLREQQEAQAAARQRTIELFNSIDSSNTIHPQRKNKVKAFFFEPIQVGKDTTTQFNYTIQTILQNSSHQAQLGDILLEYDPEKGFSLDRLEKKVKTKAAQGFRQLIEETLGSKPKNPQSKVTQQNSTSIDWEGFLQS